MIPEIPWTEETLSSWLFETDPKNTCCKENDCFDEYDRIASTAIELMSEGQSPEEAIANALALWFDGPEPDEESGGEPYEETGEEPKRVD